MNAELLLAHYERIADAPDAVARLRRFILDLAVRGKLVPQDPKDEPASELLRRIATKRARNNKHEQVAPKMHNPDNLGELPHKWCAVPLIALGSWAIGSGFPKNEQGQSEGPYFFLKVSDMNLPGNEKYIITSNNFIDDDAAARMRARIHPPGTIIFPKIGGAIATNKRRILTKGSAIDNNCLGITFSSEVDIEWAYLLLTTLDFTIYQAGTAVPALQQGVLERIPVALPPFVEQHRIVVKVDELMSLCDRLEAARAEREVARDRLAASTLARLNTPDPDTLQNLSRFALDALLALTTRPDQIKQLRQTILNLAVRGKLVPQDLQDEPASELLKRFELIKGKLIETGKIRKPKILPSVKSSDIPVEEIPGWAWVRLGEVSTLITKGSTPTSYGHAYTSEGVNFIKVESIKKGLLLPENVLSFISNETNEFLSRSRLVSGDILFSIAGSIGTSALVTDQILPANTNQALAIIRGTQTVFSPAFLLNSLQSSVAHSVLEKARGGAMNNVSLEDIQNFVVPLPPVAEQHRIVAKVDELIALCNRLESRLTDTAATRRRLLDAFIAEALALDKGLAA